MRRGSPAFSKKLSSFCSYLPVPYAAFFTPVKRISLFARGSRDLREKRDGSEVSSSRVEPVAHVLLVSLTIHERRGWIFPASC